MTRLASAACLAMALTAVAAAHEQKQAGGKMMNHMSAGKAYTGCLERTADGGFQLAHAMAAETHAAAKANDSMMKGDSMKGDSMKGDSMKGGSMKGDSMKGDSMKSDSMKSDSMKPDTMKHDMKEPMNEPMSATTLGLSAAGVDLGKHVGHKVTVTGSDDNGMNGMSSFKVSSLKMIAASCS